MALMFGIMYATWAASAALFGFLLGRGVGVW